MALCYRVEVESRNTARAFSAQPGYYCYLHINTQPQKVIRFKKKNT